MQGAGAAMTTDTLADTGSRREQVSRLFHGWSVELSARDTKGLDLAAERLPSGTNVYLNWIPGDTYHRTVTAAAKLRAAGLTPVPHVGARHLLSFTQLADFLARLAGEAEVKQTLVIGGDSDRPVGPFESALQALETGLFEKNGIATIGIAGYPEGNPKISASALGSALVDKVARIRAGGMTPYIVTQFCFESQPVLDWIAGIRRAGIDAPVRVGLAGPASITTLMKFALRCGVGNSMRALSLRGAAIARMLTETGPDRVIEGIADADPGLRIDGLHFFCFGGFKRTADWAKTFA
jgi:methylenetetrahydrofolate reductase (NADPH)